MTKLRRRFRFGLRTLLFLPVLVAFGWWWMSWPQRTAQRFVEYLNDGNVEAAQAMLFRKSASAVQGINNDFDIWGIAARRDTTFSRSTIRSRTLPDVFRAAGEFTISKDNQDQNRHHHFGAFSIERGAIRPHTNSTNDFVTILLQSGEAEEVLRQMRTESAPNTAMRVIGTEDGKLLLTSTADGQDEVLDLVKRIQQSSTP